MPTPLTDEELQAMEARCEAATPGPWVVGITMSSGWPRCRLRDTVGPTREEQLADAEFIEAGRDDMPRLVAEVRRLRKIEEAAQRAFKHYDVNGAQFCNGAFLLDELLDLGRLLKEKA